MKERKIENEIRKEKTHIWAGFLTSLSTSPARPTSLVHPAMKEMGGEVSDSLGKKLGALRQRHRPCFMTHTT